MGPFLAIFCLILAGGLTTFAAPDVSIAVVEPAHARVTAKGKMLENDAAAFTLWSKGVLGDHIIVPQDGTVAVTVTAVGQAVDGVGAKAVVELTAIDGTKRELGLIEVGSQPFSYGGPWDFKEYTVAGDVPKGYYTVTLTHRNRDVRKNSWRHLFVRQLQITGARIAQLTPAAYAFFGDQDAEPGPGRELTAGDLQIRIDPAHATWSVKHPPSGSSATGIRPAFALGGLPVDLSTYGHTTQEERIVDPRFGEVTRMTMRFRKATELDITYVLLFSHTRPEVVGRLDFTNRTGRALRVATTATMAAQAVTVGGKAASWTVIGDGKEYNQPYRIVDAAKLKEFGCWWYAALESRATKRSLLLGSLQNNKGMGRFVLVPRDANTLRAAAYHDYEGITMPPDASITGELVLLQFGSKGTQSLERFGDAIAAVHDIHLRRDFPHDPHDPVQLCLYNGWGGYGASVVSRFPYKNGRDPEQQKHAYRDPAWSKANRKRLYELKLARFGYGGHRDGWKKLAWVKERPLARRYGQLDEFVGKGAIVDGHPDWYIEGCIDFSNPEVIAFERDRILAQIATVQAAKRDRIIVYNWDFVNRWRTLPGQHDPFLTGAETYRTALELWRDLTDASPGGGYGNLYMNVIGINYGLPRTMRVGEDSDRGYYGDDVFTEGCTFTEGLVRQLSGRYFYNGRVFWINPDSFHAYVGGLYSHQQGKVHASFCAIAGNRIAVAEPFTEYDEPIPEDRLEIIRRVAPALAETARAVDVFEHCPARLWDIRVNREFGSWHIVGLFNTDHDRAGKAITHHIRFADLELDPQAEYLVYEFWRKTFLGVRKGGFTRTLPAPDCEVHAVVAKQDRPVLVSTSRHVRHMAFDIMALDWNAGSKALSGTSRVVAGDPYQLRIFVPPGFTAKSAKAGELPVQMKAANGLLTLDLTSPKSMPIHWQVEFTQRVFP
ncbi:MAG: hypothetical protein HN380_22260 [Victivallales bacterium]|jgi:hypothetical protein|nr:hypothetical protein [Victivallales bacterium]